MVRVDVITSDSQFTVCEQGLHGYEITECKVTMQLNAVSSAVIKTPPTNTHIQPLTSGISPVIAIYDNARLEFIGSIASHKTDLWGNVEIQLDGALSWLSDIVKPPFTVTNKTHAEYINAIMTQYNAAMTENGTEERIVWFGGVVGFSGNVDIHHSDEYVNTLDLLREAVEMYGGYFFETFGDGVAHPAVGWIREPIIDSGVVIEFGVNELALESQLDFSNFATRVYAVGKTNSITYTASAPDLEMEYGRRDYAIKTDAEDQSTLAAQAVAVLNARKIPVRTIEVTAAELGLMGQRADALEIGSTATLLDRKLGDDVVLMVNRIERDLINRQNTRVSLGRSPVTITGVVSNGGSSSSVSSSGGGAISMPDAVLFTPQNLTPSQQSIARNNIGAFDGEGIPTKTSELTNDSGFVTQATAAAAAPVQSVNGKTGAVFLKTSDLQNDSGYITSAPVASVNGKTGTVVLSASDVGAMPDNYVAPVQSVNGQTGAVVLDADDVGALADNAPVVTYAAQQLTDAQKAQARANIGAIADAVSDVIYDIYAEFVPHASGDYYNFTGGANASTILSALNRKMLPIVRNNYGNIKRKWYFADYNDDGEDVYIQFFRETRYGTETMMYTESEGKAYVLSTNLSQFARKPVTVWHSPNVANGLIALNTNISSSLAWQLTDLDLTPFARIKIYVKAGRKTGSLSADSSITPASIIEMSLDDRAKETVSQNAFLGSSAVQNPNDPNRLGLITCAVSGDKTKFAVLRATTLYGTAATSNTDAYPYVFKIEGYYD